MLLQALLSAPVLDSLVFLDLNCVFVSNMYSCSLLKIACGHLFSASLLISFCPLKILAGRRSSVVIFVNSLNYKLSCSDADFDIF